MVKPGALSIVVVDKQQGNDLDKGKLHDKDRVKREGVRIGQS